MNKLNPVSKVRIIAESLTTDAMLVNQLLGIISRSLTTNQIDTLFAEVNTRFKGEKVQFKLLFD